MNSLCSRCDERRTLQDGIGKVLKNLIMLPAVPAKGISTFQVEGWLNLSGDSLQNFDMGTSFRV